MEIKEGKIYGDFFAGNRLVCYKVHPIGHNHVVLQYMKGNQSSRFFRTSLEKWGAFPLPEIYCIMMGWKYVP